MAIDLHTAQIQGFFDGPVDHLFALPLLAEYVSQKYVSDDITVVSPDTGRVRMAEQWADRLGGTPLAFIHKTRDPMVPNQIKANRVVGDVSGRVCVLVDDMIDTGRTIVRASEVLFDAGAADVIIVATHGVLSDPARELLSSSKVPRGRHHQHAPPAEAPDLRPAHSALRGADDRDGGARRVRGRLGH